MSQLILTSETGSGWLDQQDVQPCCQVGVNNPVTTCCPQVQLQALSCGNAQVLPSTVWGECRGMHALIVLRCMLQLWHGMQTCRQCSRGHVVLSKPVVF